MNKNEEEVVEDQGFVIPEQIRKELEYILAAH